MICEHNQGTTENDSYCLIQREMDRLYFLTGRKIDFVLESIQNDNGTLTGITGLRAVINAVEDLPNNITRQNWELNTINIQLRLWSLCFLPSIPPIPLSSKINLLFQIIEIDFPNTGEKGDYPPYDNPANPPAPRTESKLLRDLMSHGNSPVGGPQLRLYCQFLGLPPQMHDPTSPQFFAAIDGRMYILIAEAKQIIDHKIDRV